MDNNIGIRAISMACGVLTHSIRTWETRYQVFSPQRNSGGQRVYSEEDLEKARLIGKLINMGHTISSLSRLTIDELEKFVRDIPVVAQTSTDTQVSIKSLLDCLSSYNIDGVVSEVFHLRVSCGAKDFIFKVVLPVMQNIGNKVAEGEYSVTQEHIISTILREQLGQLNLPNIGDGDRRVALATPDGNLHELSIQIAEILCRANKIPTSYLGASHPAESLGEAVNALKIKTVVIGAVSSDHWDYEKNMIKYLEKLDKYLNVDITIVLGGGWILDFPIFKHIRKVKVIESFENFDNSLKEFEIAI